MARMIFKQKLTLNKAGELLSSISHGDLERITHLEIEGKINADDFETMRDDMYSLTHINIRECDIEEIDGYGADKVPDMAFTHYIGHNDIGDKVYQAKRWLKKVILPKSATVIGSRAFCNSKKLRKVKLPKSLYCICDEAFKGCKRLQGDLEFPPSLKSIGAEAFRYCNSLDSDLIFPDGLANIGSGAFQYCPKIYTVVLPKSDCKIGIAAFGSCEKIHSNLVIPEGCERIEPMTFFECQCVKSVEIPKTCTEIGKDFMFQPLFLEKVIIHATTPPKLGEGAFRHQGVQADLLVPEGCYDAYAASQWREQFHCIVEHTRTVELSDSCSLDSAISEGDKYYIERIVLKGRTTEQDLRTMRTKFRALTHIDLRECVIEDDRLPINAFLNCKTLVEMLLPNNITSVGDAAFCGCHSLRKVHFSDTLREVGDMAFDGCRSLTEVLFDSSIIPTFGLKVFNGTERCVGVVPDGCAESYQRVIYTAFDTFANMVERTVRVKSCERWAAHKRMGDDETKHVTHLIVEGNIDQRDFSYIRDNCHCLEELDLRKATIVEHKRHKANIIPENALCVTCYDLQYELYGMQNLKKVILPKGVTKIGKYAFSENVEVIAAEDYCPF